MSLIEIQEHLVVEVPIFPDGDKELIRLTSMVEFGSRFKLCR